jgi:hypothetical protein
VQVIELQFNEFVQFGIGLDLLPDSLTRHPRGRHLFWEDPRAKDLANAIGTATSAVNRAHRFMGLRVPFGE